MRARGGITQRVAVLEQLRWFKQARGWIPGSTGWGRNNVPDSLPVIDGLLAVMAQEHGLTLVSRNVRDVERCGVSLLNPFSDQAAP